MNTVEIERKRSKINEYDRYSAAHNGLVAGSGPPFGLRVAQPRKTEGRSVSA